MSPERRPVAVVTGASRGTGLAISRALAADGYRVGLLARPGASLDAAAGELGEAALPLPADLCDPDDVRAAFAQVADRFGALDVLINNAASARPHRIEQASDDELRQEVGTNLLGPMYTVRAAVPLLRRSPRPQIINISSESVTDPFPYLVVYAATKAALETITYGLTHELRADGIRVTLLRIGQTVTTFKDSWDEAMLAEALAAWEAGGFKARVSGAVAQPPERVAEAVLVTLRQAHGSVISELSVRAFS
ncbi:SDR family oxidoreductase [Parafrankia elaeagni]|uniref:SDR family oxidoreductase n=1 Tax=Parafrankia elaeagni TaxID=222534 RepID=UPI00036DA553|nr:SDR family oxidoreductase [Parafrankia elaeagni]